MGRPPFRRSASSRTLAVSFNSLHFAPKLFNCFLTRNSQKYFSLCRRWMCLHRRHWWLIKAMAMHLQKEKAPSVRLLPAAKDNPATRPSPINRRDRPMAARVHLCWSIAGPHIIGWRSPPPIRCLLLAPPCQSVPFLGKMAILGNSYSPNVRCLKWATRDWSPFPFSCSGQWRTGGLSNSRTR